MAWTVEFSDFAQRQLRGLDHIIRKRILDYFHDRIEGCKNPRHFGEPLRATLSGLWRYRVAEYRVICRIEDDRVVVLVLNIGHRQNVYT